MSWREFIASLVSSLAWPAVLIVAFVVFRAQLARLLSAPLTMLKAGPVEMRWDHELDSISAKVVELDPLPALEGEDEDELPRLSDLADEMPVVAVRRAFALLERRLRELADEAGLTGAETMHGGELAQYAAGHGLIKSATMEAIRGLIVLRDLSAHDPSGLSVTPERAREYIVLTQSVLYTLSLPPFPQR